MVAAQRGTLLMKLSSGRAVSARNRRLLVLVCALLNCLLPAVVRGRRPSPVKVPLTAAPSEAETSDLSAAAAALARHELVPAELRGIGVRIEDDVLVTADGAVNLSAGLPRSSADVEQWLAVQREAGPRFP